MGFIDTSNVAQPSVFYNVVHAVGKNCPNIRDDVKLVQYLLKILYDKFPPNCRPNGNMTFDGLCGPVTRNWIIKFQMDFNADNPGMITIDGRVDRIRNKDFVGSISKTQYTLAVLNKNAAKLNPDGWTATPYLIPMQNLASIPPPSIDYIDENQIIKPNPKKVPEVVGGF
jgi:hypothetical protein